MIARLVPVAFGLLVGCASTAATTADEGAPGPRKQVRCTHYAETGSRIMKRTCENDAPKHNLVNMPREELRNMQMKMSRFKDVSPGG